MEKYQSALEYVNGTYQINADRLREIRDAEVNATIAANDLAKTQKI